MCTFQRCSKPDLMYASRVEWYQHELEEHRVEWFCNTTGHQAYKLEQDFVDHMELYHASSISSKQLQSLMESFQRPFLEEGIPCTLCKIIPKDTRKHLAHHQIQLALFALPRRYFGDDEQKWTIPRNLDKRWPPAEA